MFTQLYGLETVSIRYFNVFGPRQDPTSPYSGVISVFATALIENRSPTIYGDGEQTRDFTYVANVVDGVLRACEAQGASGEVINVATGGRISLNQLFDDDAALVGATVKPTYAETRVPATCATPRPTSPRRSGFSATSRRVSFEQGLERTVAWYRTATTAGTPA